MELSRLGSAFPGHYWPTEAEFKTLWTEGVLVLDASVLLSFYRYSDDTRQAMLRVFARFAGRIFVPHQSAEEFQRNRLTVIGQQVAVYKEIESELTKSLGTLRNRAGQLKRHPVLEAQQVIDRLDSFEEDLTAYIASRRREHPNLELTPAALMRDPIRDEIDQAVGKSVGAPYTPEAHAAAEAEAERRIEQERPPGFRDRTKGDERQYGDVIFWLQTLDFAGPTR